MLSLRPGTPNDPGGDRAAPAETVSLQDSLGRVAAANIIAADDLVPFARSAMDGFAVRAADTAGATIEQPIGLPIRGNAFAEAGAAELFLAQPLPFPRARRCPPEQMP